MIDITYAPPEDAPPPGHCRWCGSPLADGEVFVFEVESNAIYEHEYDLVEHETLIGKGGLLAACGECRAGMIENADSAEPDVFQRTGRNLHWWMLPIPLFILLYATVQVGSSQTGMLLLLAWLAIAMYPIAFGIVWIGIKLARRSRQTATDRH